MKQLPDDFEGVVLVVRKHVGPYRVGMSWREYNDWRQIRDRKRVKAYPLPMKRSAAKGEVTFLTNRDALEGVFLIGEEVTL